MVPAASRPLPSPPFIAQSIPEIRSDDLYSDPNTENEDGYEPPPGPISFPPPPPISPRKEVQVEPSPLDILEQQMAALEALKEHNSSRMSPSHTYSKPSLEKKSPPKIVSDLTTLHFLKCLTVFLVTQETIYLRQTRAP